MRDPVNKWLRPYEVIYIAPFLIIGCFALCLFFTSPLLCLSVIWSQFEIIFYLSLCSSAIILSYCAIKSEYRRIKADSYFS